MNGLRLANVCARHTHGPQVLHMVDVEAPRGQITALLGPNGSGKSSTLKAVLGLISSTGEIALDGDDVLQMSRRERATRLAYVPQRSMLSARLGVRGVVSQGRFAHRGMQTGLGRMDRQAIDKAMSATHVTDLADKMYTELSGGEQARVILARALATGANTLLLDEPTASLDVGHVLRLHDVLRTLADEGCSVLMVMHDLSEARRHADRAVLLHDGKVHLQGDANDVIATGPIRQVYGVELFEAHTVQCALPGARS